MIVLKQARETGTLASMAANEPTETYFSFWQFLITIANSSDEQCEFLSFDPNSLTSIFRPFRFHRHTLMFAAHASPFAISRLASRIRKVYLVWSIPTHRSKRMIFKSFLGRQDVVLTNDKITQNELVDLLGVAPSKVRLLPFGVDTHFFSPSEIHQGDGPLTCIIPGNAFRRERIVEEILTETDWSVIRLTRDTSRRSELNAVSEKFPGRLTLKFAVESRELPVLYRTADVAVIDSRRSSEPAGLTTLLEAKACGLPVLCSNEKAVSASQEHGGAVMHWERPGELLETLSNLPREQLRALGAKARESAVRKHDWQRLTVPWSEELYPGQTALPDHQTITSIQAPKGQLRAH